MLKPTNVSRHVPSLLEIPTSDPPPIYLLFQCSTPVADTYDAICQVFSSREPKLGFMLILVRVYQEGPREVTEEEFIDWCQEDLLNIDMEEAEAILSIMNKAASRSPLVREQVLHSSKTSSVSLRVAPKVGVQRGERVTRDMKDLEAGEAPDDSSVVDLEDQKQVDIKLRRGLAQAQVINNTFCHQEP